MPQAVTHVIITLIIASVIRELYVRKKGVYGKEKFPIHYVLIAGIAGLLPDLDIAAFWVLHYFGFTLNGVHRTFTHTIFVPFGFLLFSFVFNGHKGKRVGKKYLSIKGVLLMIALGSFIHLLLDLTLAGMIKPLYPFSNFMIGFSIISLLPEELKNLFFPSLDAALLVLWLIYLEWKHKISSFI